VLHAAMVIAAPARKKRGEIMLRLRIGSIPSPTRFEMAALALPARDCPPRSRWFRCGRSGTRFAEGGAPPPKRREKLPQTGEIFPRADGFASVATGVHKIAQMLSLQEISEDPGMFQPAASGGVLGRRLSASVVSAVAHVGVAIAAVVIVRTAPPAARRPVHMVVTLNMPAAPREKPKVMAVMLERPQMLTPAAVPAAVAVAPLPAPVPEPVIRHTPVPAPVAIASRPEPAKAQPADAHFDSPVQSTIRPMARVETANFDGVAVKTPAAKSAVAIAAGFGDQASVNPPQSRAAMSVVASGGFGSADVVQASGSTRGSVATAGFGDGGGADPRKPRPAAAVADSGFASNDPAPRTIARPGQVTQSPLVPMEVLTKPTPSYTTEARVLKIEGEVLLDVEFSASGVVRVIGVKHGLGHGLDESAVDAASQIRFKPAQRDGQPVDFRATVRMTFRLT